MGETAFIEPGASPHVDNSQEDGQIHTEFVEIKGKTYRLQTKIVSGEKLTTELAILPADGSHYELDENSDFDPDGGFALDENQLSMLRLEFDQEHAGRVHIEATTATRTAFQGRGLATYLNLYQRPEIIRRLIAQEERLKNREVVDYIADSSEGNWSSWLAEKLNYERVPGGEIVYRKVYQKAEHVKKTSKVGRPSFLHKLRLARAPANA